MIILEKSGKGVYKDFEDFFKVVISTFKIKDKLEFRKELEKLIKTINVEEENDNEIYKYSFFKLIEKYGG